MKLIHVFHLACRKNNVAMTRLLLESPNKMNPNAKGKMGMVGLHFAARSGCTKMVQYLLSIPGINLSIQDDSGKTPLDAAKANQRNEVVALLQTFSA
jgi:ankyrin repeat protein